MDTKLGNKKAIGWLSTAHIVNDTYSGFLNPIMPFIADKIGITMALATVVMSIAHICSSLFQPLFGLLADNTLKRNYIFWGLLLSSLFIPFAPTAHNVVFLTLFIICGSVGGSLFHPQALWFVSRFSKPEEITKNMAIFISAGTLGFSFGPIISAVVAQNFGLDKIPYTTFIGLATTFAMFLFVPKISNIDKKPQQKEFLTSFKKVVKNNKIMILTLISMMKSLITNSCSILLPFLWKDMGYSPTYIGMALFAFIFMGGIGSFVSEKLERLIGAKNVFYLSMIGTLPMMMVFVATYKTHPNIALVVFILTGFVTMLAMPVTMVMAQSLMPEYKSVVSGLINGFSWGIVAVFLTLVGFSAQSFGIVKVLFIVSFIPAICSYFVKYLPERIKDVT